MVYKSGQISLPFCQGSRVWQTDGRTDRQTEFSSLYRVCITCSAVKTIQYNTKKQKHRQTCVRTNKHQMYKVYKGSRESLNKRLLPESYFMRNLLVLSAIMALGNLKPNINWHSVTIWISLVLNNFIKNRLTEKSSDPRLV